MQDFTQHYYAANKQYKFTIKIARNDLGADDAAKLENFLDRYDLVSFKPFKRTPMRDSPLDFPMVKATEVYITDVIVNYPVTSNLLLRGACDAIGVRENQMVVYSENDPRKGYTEDHLAREEKSGEAKLGNPADWPEEAKYGEEYNSDFIKGLHSVEEQITTITTDSIPSEIKSDAEKSEPAGFGTASDSPLTNGWKNATEYSPRKDNTLMSTNKEGK